MLSAHYPSLRDKRVIVTGGASGIGEAIVEAFALQGAQVGFIDILSGPAQDLVRRLSEAPHVPVFSEQDVADAATLGGTLAALVETLGGCDVLVNNAASDDRHALDVVTPAYWDQRLAVNLKHAFFASQGVWPDMKANGGGVILNLGSISWHLGLDDLALYQIAKAGIEGLTRSLARELGPFNIRVNTIIPGNVQTERQMRWYTPEGEAEIVPAGPAGTCITKGPAISPGDARIYFTDTLAKTIHVAAMGPDGTIGEAELFADVARDFPDAYPEGPVCDAEGCVWAGLWNGWGAARYSADGVLLEKVDLLVANVTKIAFGGPDFTRAFVTTARKGLDAAALKVQPMAGDLFAFDVAVPGMAPSLAEVWG